VCLDDRKVKRMNEETDLRAVLDGIFALVAILSADGVVLEVNRASLEPAGLRREDVIGMPFVETYWWSSLPESQAKMRRALEAAARGEVVREDFEVRMTDDRLGTVCGVITPLTNEAGEIHRLVASGIDVTERKRTQKALRQTEERFRQIAESIHEVFWLSNPDTGELLYISPAYEAIWGRPRDTALASFSDWLDAIHPEDRARVVDFCRTAPARGKSEHEYRIVRPDGTIRWVRDRGRPVRQADAREPLMAGVIEDITERRDLEAQLRQSHRMEGIGQVAAGVAQDFNNLLTVITGYSDLVIASLPPGDPNREPLEGIRKAGARSTAMTRELLAFSRKQVLAPKVLVLNDIVRDTSTMLRRVVGDDVQVVAVLDSGAGAVRVDPGQMEQVLLNLGVNARDAMPRGGTLTIETKNVELDEGYASAPASVLPGPYMMVAMTDSGNGMSDETQRQLFEPFFTTKRPGQGSGLGLAMVHGFIKQSDGHVEVQSTEGIGTTFRIFLPRVKPIAPAGTVTPEGPSGIETILLVEDDAAVRALTRRVLERYGYTVLDTGDGDEALRIAATRDGPIHLLVTDVEMPGMPGRVVAERLLAVRPATRVLYFSGYTDDAVVRHSISQGTIHFLEKPFSMEALALKVREALSV
jgi:two-component system cell cycle sensor histidine kinase/response regulator CckA